jgi:UDP-N-acetylmuramoyl-tripeptide--D-alanyl-D-alanine ligase
VEAGAREKGDIKEIAEFVENEYAIIGKIGPQHIEYFKIIENIINTKKEILLSPKLKKAITYEVNEDKCVEIKDKIKNIKATLNGIEWDLEYKDQTLHLTAPILGT